VIIPSFAVGRVEEVLYWLKRLEDSRQIPILPVYVDSPMAAGALQFYTSYATDLDPDVQPAARHVAAFTTGRLTVVASPQQSAEIIASKSPAIVIASSGMATGGRVLNHLIAALPNANNTVLFVGYQAVGTRGRTLVDGGKEVRIKGRDVPVAATIAQLESMSAHADASEIMRWLGGFARPPSITHLVHGEPVALEALRERIVRERRWNVHVASYLETVTI
jgi:metallo-beta-lactamase family protein